ncbi:MAG: acyltransferase [Bacteroidia bacterium]
MSQQPEIVGKASVIPSLDGLRGLAVLLVLAYHFGLLRFGWLGVGLFFTLSGFLITRLLLETKDLSLGKYLGQFYWRRVLRILPLYFGFVLAVMAVFWMTGKPSGAGVQFPWLATFTYNIYMGLEQQVGLQQIFHVLWSISTEEQYYFVWPMVVWLLPRRALGWVAVGLVLAAPVIRYFEADMVRGLGVEVWFGGKASSITFHLGRSMPSLWELAWPFSSGTFMGVGLSKWDCWQ